MIGLLPQRRLRPPVAPQTAATATAAAPTWPHLDFMNRNEGNEGGVREAAPLSFIASYLYQHNQ